MQGPCKHPKLSAWYLAQKKPPLWRRDCLGYSCAYYETYST